MFSRAQTAVPSRGRSLQMLRGGRYVPDVPTGMFNSIQWYMQVTTQRSFNNCFKLRLRIVLPSVLRLSCCDSVLCCLFDHFLITVAAQFVVSAKSLEIVRSILCVVGSGVL
jgi:hypothetical protein